MKKHEELLIRSMLFVPAHNEKLMDSASKVVADMVFLDIEDSVQPIENKQVARDRVVEYVAQDRFKGRMVFPRVNDRESGELLRDLMQLTIPGVDGFVYPKSYTGQDIYFIDKLLTTIEYEKKMPVGTFKLVPLIETAAAVLNAQEICRASDRVVAIAFGCEDFMADLEGMHDPMGQSIFTARAMIAMAARANKVIPIDTVHIRVHDLEDLERNLIVAKNLGFEGMMALHPKELPLIHQYFSPSMEEIADAEEQIRLSEAAVKQGRGVAVIGNKFIGPPMVAAAKKTLAKHQLIQDRIAGIP